MLVYGKCTINNILKYETLKHKQYIINYLSYTHTENLYNSIRKTIPLLIMIWAEIVEKKYK